MIVETYLHGRVVVKVGDLTREDVDAIVNAANSSLLGGGGVDGAIHARGGPAILAACKEARKTLGPGGLATGEAVMTPAGDLPARHVIHTVGPVYGRNQNRDAELLSDCYRNSLLLAVDHDLQSIAFSSISTGVYAYPQADAARVASATIKAHLEGHEAPTDIRLVFYSEAAAATFIANQVF